MTVSLQNIWSVGKTRYAWCGKNKICVVWEIQDMCGQDMRVWENKMCVVQRRRLDKKWIPRLQENCASKASKAICASYGRIKIVPMQQKENAPFVDLLCECAIIHH